MKIIILDIVHSASLIFSYGRVRVRSQLQLCDFNGCVVMEVTLRRIYNTVDSP